MWANKTNITMQGQGFLNTSIAWNDTANSTGGTIYSASVSIFSFNFIAYNISFQASSPPSNDLVLLLATLFPIIHGVMQNTAPPASPGDVGAQAVALRIAGDQAALYGCGFYGAQDTLLDERGRHYFRECFIEGSIDFIFGNSRSLYEVRRIALRPLLDRCRSAFTKAAWCSTHCHAGLHDQFHSKASNQRRGRCHRMHHGSWKVVGDREDGVFLRQLQHRWNRESVAWQSMGTLCDCGLLQNIHGKHHSS